MVEEGITQRTQRSRERRGSREQGTGNRELPALSRAYLHERVHYEILVTVTRALPLVKRSNFCFII